MMKRVWKMGMQSLGRRAAAVVAGVGFALALGLSSAAVGASRVDLNAATLEDLVSLPGIGPAKAQAIIAHREQAPFTSADELTDVPGIGDTLAERLREHVSVGEAERQATNSKPAR